MADEARSTLEGAMLIVELLRRIPQRGFTTSRHLHEQVKAPGFDASWRTVQRHLDALCGRFVKTISPAPAVAYSSPVAVKMNGTTARLKNYNA
jgi:hypothetical protein